MKVTCPACRETVAAENISLDSGWAKCSRCQDVFELASVLPGYRQPTPGSRGTPAKLERPFDSWAIVERSERKLYLHVPAHGMRAGTWGLVGFSIFWLGFVAFWTAGALGAFWAGQNGFQWENILFAAFSAPFWLVGFGMVGTTLWMARGTRTVYFDPSVFYSELRCLIWRRRRTISRELVQHARVGTLPMKNQNRNGVDQPWYSVEIVHTRGSFQVPCDSVAERDWLVAEINDFLQSVPYEPRADFGTLEEGPSRQVDSRFFPERG